MNPMSAQPWTEDHPFYPLYRALVDFKQSHVQPPSQYYVTRDDVLQLTVATPIVATDVQLSLRFMSAQGEILPRFEEFTVQPTGATPAVLKFQNAEGYLVSASILTPDAPRGQCFVSLAIRRGGGTADKTFGDVLIQGYPGAVGGIAYPQTPNESALAGRGRMRSIVVTVPAAGADFTVTVPAGVQWILRALTGTLTTAIAVVNRQASVEVTDATPHVLLRSASSVLQVASLADVYSWFAGGAADTAAPVLNAGLPEEFRCLAGWIIKSVTAGIQAADQWTAITLTVEEFIGG
jgi:hypothetical protein